jgi:hypothetical protein
VKESVEELQERLSAALRRYNDAKAATAQATGTWADLPSPDGNDSVVRALRLENAALRAYLKVLNEYAEAVLEKPWPLEEE